MKKDSGLLDASKRLLLKRTPWLLAYLPTVRRKGLRLRQTADRIAIIDQARRQQIWINRANAVYVPDMVNSFEYYFSAVEPFQQPRGAGGFRVADYSSPRFHMVAGFTDFPILCPSLAEPFQTCEQYLDFAQLREGQTVLDLGCYSGLTAIAFSKAVKGAGHVVSVEPDPGNFAACVQNFDLHRRMNGSHRITLLPLAVSSHGGTLTFSSEGAMGSSAVAIVGGYRGDVVEIPCATLDEIVQQSRAGRIDFIKMDIEGSELDVIRNAGAFLRTHRPRMIIEPHVVNGELDAKELVGCLTSYGYHCEIIEQWGVALPLVTAVPV
jgi:FkbM family methyltransferase